MSRSDDKRKFVMETQKTEKSVCTRLEKYRAELIPQIDRYITSFPEDFPPGEGIEWIRKRSGLHLIPIIGQWYIGRGVRSPKTNDEVKKFKEEICDELSLIIPRLLNR